MREHSLGKVTLLGRSFSVFPPLKRKKKETSAKLCLPFAFILECAPENIKIINLVNDGVSLSVLNRKAQQNTTWQRFLFRNHCSTGSGKLHSAIKLLLAVCN